MIVYLPTRRDYVVHRVIIKYRSRTTDSLVEIDVEADTGRLLKEAPDPACYKDKVVDTGRYLLVDPNGHWVREVADYVPGFIPNLYGDYLNLLVEGGVVVNWSQYFTVANVEDWLG